MKIKIQNFSFIVFICFLVQTIQAQDPNWSVNSANYQYSMTFTSFLNSNGTTLTSSNDQVAAFVNGEIRGVANVQYVASANKYVAYLSVFANTDAETINFKIYDSAAQDVINIDKTETFRIDSNLGGIAQSYSIAQPQLNENAVFNSFSFLGITAVEISMLSDKITLILPRNTDVSSLTAIFETSTNSKVFVENVLQSSGGVSRDFTTSVVYKVLSEDEATLSSYEVSVSIDTSVAPTTVVLSTTHNLTTNTIPVSVDVTFSNVVSDFELSDFIVDNAVVSSLSTSDSKNYKVDVIPLSEGNFSVQVPANVALDVNNNLNEISNSIAFTYDISKPIISNISVDSDATSWWFLVTFNEDVISVDRTDFELKGAASIALSIADVIAISSKQYKIEIANSNTDIGAISVQLKSATDIADNFGNLAKQSDLESYFLNNGALSDNASTKTKNYIINYDFESWLNPFSLDAWGIESGDGTGNTYSQIGQEKSVTRGASSVTAVRYYVTAKSKGFLKTSAPIVADAEGRYFFGVWVKATNVGDKISIGIRKNTNILTDIYTATNTDWAFVVKYFDVNIADEITPVIIPETENVTFYIDDVSLGQGLANSTIEWHVTNGIVKTHIDFFETEPDAGTTNASISEETGATNIQEGKKSLKVVTTATANVSNKGIVSFKANTTVGNRYQHPALTKREYRAAVWAKSETVADVFCVLNVAGVNTTSSKITLAANTWTEVFSPVVLLDGSNSDEIEIYPKLYFTSPNTTYYVDNFYLDWNVEGVFNNSVWNGSVDTDWANLNNWNSNKIPTATNDVLIPNVAIKPIIKTGTIAIVNNITIATAAELTIESGGALTSFGNLSQNGTFTINSDATANGSLIVKGTSLGDITYLRYLTTNWHLISSPVFGQSINSLSGEVTTSGNRYGIAPYKNNVVSTSGWSHYTTSNIGDAGNFLKAKGYSIQKSGLAGTIALTGSLYLDDIGESISITDGVDGLVGTRWNLIGNPYTASLHGNNAADAANNFLKVNIDANILDPARAGMYLWNGTPPYEVKSLDDAAFYIAPGQAFFVHAPGGGGTTASFTETMQTHQTGNVFLKSSTTYPEMILHVTDNANSSSTKIRYIEDKTTGLDPGSDVGTFTLADASFEVYTHLVSNDTTVAFAIQALPNTNYENMIVPVGMHAEAGKEITFSLNRTNFIGLMQIFLEDKVTNTFTRLDEVNSSYKVTLTDNLSGIGRFYLHTTQAALSLDNNFNLDKISIYKLDKTTLKIAGLPEGTATIKIYSMLGKQVMSTSFTANVFKDLALPNVSKGIYLVQLETENGKLNKKIIIE